MNMKKLKVGDRIRITRLPVGEGCPGCYIQRDTSQVYKKIIARGRSVRISFIDNDGTPWFECRFKSKTFKWEYHFLSVLDEDENWTLVKQKKMIKNIDIETHQSCHKKTETYGWGSFWRCK